jgi:phytoene dehydrogenase-like protein
MAGFDFVIVGSGINSLVCAAVLAKAGKSVIVLERDDRPGGCIRTEELFPGYTHDVLSSWYPLFVTSPAYAALGDDLHARGLEFAQTDKPTAVVNEAGSLILTTDDHANTIRLNKAGPGDGDRYASSIGEFFAENSDITFSLLGNELWSGKALRTIIKDSRRRGMGGTLEFFGQSLETCRAWLERDFSSELVRGLIAPWVLHAGLGPDDAYSGFMAKLIMGTLSLAGMPVVKGGSYRIVEAFRSIIEDNGGSMVTGADVESVMIEGGRAIGVRTGNGDIHSASKAVICNVTPTQLYERLLGAHEIPPEVRQRAARFRYGRADMQIHFALDQTPAWHHPELAQVAMVHITPGLDGVSRAVNEAERGLLPVEATVVVGQPTAVDPSRAPDGKAIIWVQLQELPSHIRGDGADEIRVPDDGEWAEEVAERYADRIQARIGRHVANFDEIVLGRRVFSPADLETLNPNLVGGDPYSGACTIDQFLAWRPTPGSRNHETGVQGLFHIGASTHPGPGLGGNSGFMVASKLT